MQTNDRFYDKYRERKLFTIALLITIDSFQTWFSSIYIHHLLRKNMSKIFIAYHKNSISKFINTSVFCFSILFTLSLHSETIKKFKIVIDPGHGGTKQTPYEIYGDKFDTVSGRYLEPYKNGASYKNRTENEIVLQVGNEIKEILDLTKTKKGFKKFQTYIKIFSDSDSPWIKIDASMTRSDSYLDKNYREKDDKNELYRLYDFPDFSTGEMKDGRITFINKEEPQLVVSLHINDMGSKTETDNGGMGVVLTPSYQTFELLKRISEKKVEPDQFLNSPWSNWMIFERGWSRLENAIADSWIYFHGYWPTKEGNKADLNRFEGYRYNMVNWKYKDSDGWEEKINTPNGPYALDHTQFRSVGKYWDRERSKPEMQKRENGPEGYGGDNHYAGMEILRFIQYALRTGTSNSDDYKSPNPILSPYISTYSLPALVNAISAYIELGDIRSNKDYYYLTQKKRRTAIAISVAIYSLCNGLEIRNIDTAYIPKGKKIEFDKYINKNGNSYFINLQEKDSDK
jgi:N-acetylmuramoyl-L-alanine amidase